MQCQPRARTGQNLLVYEINKKRHAFRALTFTKKKNDVSKITNLVTSCNFMKEMFTYHLLPPILPPRCDNFVFRR